MLEDVQGNIDVVHFGRHVSWPHGSERIMKIAVFTGPAGLQALAPAWSALIAQSQYKRHFHHIEWHLALAETVERHNLSPLHCIAAFSEKNTLTAILPIRFARLRFGQLQFSAILLASDQNESYTARDFIAPAGFPTDIIQKIATHIFESDSQIDALAMPGLLEDSNAATALQHISLLPYVIKPGGAYGVMEFISCGDEDRPLERLSRGFKQNLRTSHNKLKSKTVTFETACTESDLRRLFTDFLRVESSGWKGELGTSALKHGPTHTFLEQLISRFAPSGSCEIRVVRVDGQPIASLFGIVTDGIWFIVRTGYDESYHAVSPGHLAIEALLNERPTKRAFKTLTPYNAPPWFRAWKPDRVLKVHDAWIFRPSPRGVELANRTLEAIHSGIIVPEILGFGTQVQQ